MDENIPELGIAIRCSYRGQGLGAALMKKVIAHCRERGIVRISLSVSPGNLALNLYRKLGFYKVGKIDDF